MRYALAILLLCAACSSGGNSKRPDYPPGYVMDTVAVTDGLVSHYRWRPDSGKTVMEYWLRGDEQRSDVFGSNVVVDLQPDKL